MAVWQISRKLAPAALLGAACLVKETSILQLAAIVWPERGSRGTDRFVGSCAIAIVPVAAWLGYVSWIHAEMPLPSSGQITLPFVSLATKFMAAGSELWERVRDGGRLGRLIFELLAPASLVVQAFYLVRKPRLASREWRFGAGFVLLLPFLGDLIWAAQYAYCRVLLPLTASFNLLVHRHEEGWGHARWFLAGNVGMIWILLRVLD